MTLDIVSYGGGVQSTSLLVLAAQGKINYKTFCFANVGDDSEHPDTIKYVHEVAMPFAKEHDIELIELHKHLRDGSVDTLYQQLVRGNTPSIPVHFEVSGMGQRGCTKHFKIVVVDKWLKAQGAKGQGATVALGISMDEFQRVKPNMNPETMKWKEHVFPLIDLRMDRQDCMNIIESADLPIPPKSACWFCPFSRVANWQKMREDKPDLFEKAVDLEKLLNEKRVEQGKNKVWLSNKLIPLTQVTTNMKQHSLPFEEEGDVCDSGYCFL